MTALKIKRSAWLKLIMFAVLGFLLSLEGLTQNSKLITGTILEAQAPGEPPLVGVNITVKGKSGATSQATLTDNEGKYRITVPDNGILIFSYVGFETQELSANGQTVINVNLVRSVGKLNEVVVTALGIKRETKSLTYSSQTVKTENLIAAREVNIMNSLQGKVAGLSVNFSGAGVGSPARVILRGNRSISGDSQPLYVIDGVPVIGNPAGINADDIASINVLKGPNAAALYGSAAQNGAIIIETKKGSVGAINFSLNQNTQLFTPIHSIQFQNEYAQGFSGAYSSTASPSWGPKMTGQMVNQWSLDPQDSGKQYALTPQPDNVRDLFQNGFNTTTSLFGSIGSEKIQGMFSLTRTDAQGIVPRNSIGRNNITIRVTGQLSSRLTMDVKMDYMKQNLDNPLATYTDPVNAVEQLYVMPRSIRTEDAKHYTYVDAAGVIKQNFWTPGSTDYLNPYFVLNRSSTNASRQRGIAMASLTYKFTNALKLMVRGSYDAINEYTEIKFSKDFYSRALNGRYTVTESDQTLFNTDFLLSYTKKLKSDWEFNINFGGNIQRQKNHSLSANTNVGLIVPDLFTLSNTLAPKVTDSPGPNIDIHSLYSLGQVNWKNRLFLDLTGRNDWSSTLPAANRSYFYPSIGLSAILSDLIPHLPEQISFVKLWGSWAKVGNGGPAYMLSRTARLVPGGNNGFLQINTVLPNSNLQPEETNSFELGLNISFFKDRLGLNATWYKTNTLNQLFTIALPPGSGASSLFTNGGDVENKGVEILLNIAPIRSRDFRWDAEINFSRNRNLVKKLNDERPRLIVASDASFRDFVIAQGEPFGQIYSVGFLRDNKGQVIVGDNGVPKNTGNRSMNVANANPDWMGGITNSFQYKNFSLSFLIDHRQGGTVLSITKTMLMYAGTMAESLEGREGGLIFGQNFFSGLPAVKENGSPNDIAMDAQTFWRALGGTINPVGEAFVERMTNTRLRELAIGYTFPKSLIRNLPFSNVKLSLVGRNLFFLHRASRNIDPDVIEDISVVSEGKSILSLPTTRSIGFNLKMDFGGKQKIN